MRLKFSKISLLFESRKNNIKFIKFNMLKFLGYPLRNRKPVCLFK